MMQYTKASEAVIEVIVLRLHAGNNNIKGAIDYAKRATWCSTGCVPS
jgi:hypothetical protein